MGKYFPKDKEKTACVEYVLKHLDNKLKQPVFKLHECQYKQELHRIPVLLAIVVVHCLCIIFT